MKGFIPLVAALALVLKLVDFAKLVRVRDVDATVTQLATWVAGTGVIMILAHSDFAGGIMVATTALSKLNTWSLIIVGMSVGSSGSITYDFKRALDRSDSAAMPSLVTGHVPIVPPPTVGEDTHKTAQRSARKDQAR